MTWVSQRGELQDYARTFEPSSRLVATRWLRGRAITLGALQLYPASWTADQVRYRIPHECQHTKQARQLGLLRFLLAYLFSGQQRARLEVEAEAAYWRTLTGADRASQIGDSARTLAAALASWRYGWAVTRAEADRLCAEAVAETGRDDA